MSEAMKDSAIKLFGKTIILLPDKVVSDVSVSEQRQSSLATSTSQDSKDESGGDFSTRNRQEYEPINPAEETQIEAATSSEIDDDNDTPETPKKEQPSESNASQERTLKKPDKILPCPRCNSMDTKFCYYNNYKVNQPRYFCKNCQRYWTSGGTMRNVPVGSGRRKNKNAVIPNFRHIVVSDTLQNAQADARNGIHYSSVKPNSFLIGPHSGFPVSFYPVTTYWNVPLAFSAVGTNPTSSLGKHTREGNVVRTSNLGKENENLADAERSVLIPKTLRIHDPNEAAKSSIWSTLGIKKEKTGSFSGTGLFKAFESKGDRSVDNTTMVLQANPAALSRSLNFQERA